MQVSVYAFIRATWALLAETLTGRVTAPDKLTDMNRPHWASICGNIWGAQHTLDLLCMNCILHGHGFIILYHRWYFIIASLAPCGIYKLYPTLLYFPKCYFCGMNCGGHVSVTSKTTLVSWYQIQLLSLQ